MKQIIKSFNSLVKRTIFNVQNKTNNKFTISTFNKYFIIIIAVLFFYLFYLLIPVLYDKDWVQNNIEGQIINEFKINVSSSADISYRILPAPHFLIKNSRLLIGENLNQKPIADVKNLKVFLSQKNLLNKEKITFKKLIIDNANFSFLRNELKILNDSSNNQFSNKKIKINNSNIFLRNNLDEIITIIKINEATLFFDNKKQLNLFDLKANVFGVPFNFSLKSNNESVINKKVNLDVKYLHLNIYNESISKDDNSKSGKNIISFLNNTIKTKYDKKEKLITFTSDNTKYNSSKVNYQGKLSTDPFDLNLNIDLGNYKISKLFNDNSTLKELIKSEILFNKNLSVDVSIFASTNAQDEIFQNAKINFNIVNGKINLNKSRFTNKKIGLLKLDNSNLFLENNKLVLNTDMLITIKNAKRLFSTLNTNKRSRKNVENILINLDYDFLSNEISFNKVITDNNKVSHQFLDILEGFNENNLNNLIKSRRLINKLFDIYDG